MSTSNYDAPEIATTPAPSGRRRVSAIVGLFIAAILVLALLVFVVQNTEQAHIEFFSLNLDMAQGVALLLAASVGFLIAALGSGILVLRRRIRNRHR
jgi:uncharacterized integral membrane protein